MWKKGLLRSDKNTSLKPTREGKRFLIATGVLLFAAINTGNNLIYLILSLMLSLGVAAVVLPFLNLRGLSFEIDIPEGLFAGDRTELSIRAHNKKGLPSFSIKLVSALTDEEFYFKRVPKNSSSEISREVAFPRRGIYDLRDLKVRTSFPFIFFVLTRRVPFQKKVIVYPELIEMEGPSVEDLLSVTSRAALKAPTGDYPQSIRAYIQGDPMRHIHWKATAKLQALMVKEFYRERPEEITIVLDNSASSSEEDFERAVSICATLLVRISELEIAFRLLSCDKAFPFGSGRTHLLAQLDYLAGVKKAGQPRCPLKEEDQGPVILVAPRRPSALEAQIGNLLGTYYASPV